MTSILKMGVMLAVLAATGLFSLALAWHFGYVSRAVAVAASPDGQIEAVCRGRLPESTEYDLWFRHPGEMFGRRAGLVGSESMGRCRTVVWSPDGQMVATLSEGGTIGVFDGTSGRAIGFQRLPGLGYDYTPEKMVTSIAFPSRTEVAFELCARRRTPGSEGSVPLWQCGSTPVRGAVPLDLEPPRGAFGR